ncbi:class I SAM-dependent methyltransferase [Robertmurraya yapensis]|uniref:Class I SAM-dependent methyltransferase n=1 Tax=Bacillus yapensis TaxID=2492960 RepID=A0A3S0KQW2_9BACI|nr:class I SAM-dependent methyltransferase [Bacillus yapensis]RTR36211.1 class I SAM-dependent methyltransferase [Bacillus yapensis]TKT05714.1 methyltransferase domain-containing protein [Bacillus yapensis]
MERNNLWNANLYDGRHNFVSQFGQSLVELLAPKPGERILDLGCGTGDLAHQIYENGVDVVGVDSSVNMVEQAKNKYPDINFIVEDATSLEYDSEFDAVFSNATLHWVKPPIKALLGIYDSLKPGGRFVAEFGGKGNVQTISNGILFEIEAAGFEFKKAHFPWFYPSIAEYSTLMEEVGFRVTFAQHFDRPTTLDGDDGLRNWIQMFGNQLFTGVPEESRAQIITNVENHLKEILHKDGRWVADYKRIRVIGIKE